MKAKRQPIKKREPRSGNGASSGCSLQRLVRLRLDLQWCYDRLSHLAFIWDNPKTVQAGFGPGETMNSLRKHLEHIRRSQRLSDCYTDAATMTHAMKTEPKRGVRVQRLVSLRCRLTTNEHTLLMNMLGMASNDPVDQDHLALTSLREKIRDGFSAG